MAGTATVIFESRMNRALNLWHSHETLVVPISYKLALFTSSAGLEAGTPANEVSADNTGYVRQNFTLDANQTNAADITFPVPGPGNWGTVTHTGIYAEVSSGIYELWFWGRVIDPETLQDKNITLNANSAPFWVQAGNLSLTIS